MRVLLLLLLLMCLRPSGFALDDKDSLKGLELEQAKLPIYNKEQLQVMAFCNRAVQDGKLMVTTGTVLDIIRRDADIDALRDCWNLKLYSLDAPLTEIVEFWTPRLYSEGIVKTDRMDIEQKERTASGDEPVYFRSPALDMDGVGFDSDFKRRTIFVRSNVKMVLRMAEDDPRNILQEKRAVPNKKNFIQASGNSLLVDSENDQVMLIGSVKIVEGDSQITCDRMTVFLARKENGGKKAESVQDQLEGISRLLCDGNVVISNRKNPSEQAIAEHLIYDVKNQRLTFSGENSVPVIKRGDESISGRKIYLFRDTERAVVVGDCKVKMLQKGETGNSMMTVTSDNGQFFNKKNYIDFLGNVRVDESRMLMTCDRMRILLYETAAPEKAPGSAAKKESKLTGLPEFGSRGGDRQLDEIKCRGNVRIEHKPVVKDDKTTAETAFQHWMSSGKAQTWEPCAGAMMPATIINADDCDVKYKENVIHFKNNVKLRDIRVMVDCSDMYLYLAEKRDGSGKTISRIVCDGSVYLVEGGGKMWTDKLTLLFREAAGEQKTASAMLEHDGVELIQVIGEGNFKMVSAGQNVKGKNNKKNGLGGLTGSGNGTQTLTASRGELDLLKNESRFFDNVVLSGNDGVLRCQEMYLYSARTGETEKTPDVPAPAAAAEEDPDADPLSAGIERKSAVPEKIIITRDLELNRVLCKRDVQLDRKTLKGVQKAGGDTADYQVSTGKIIVTADEGKQAWMQNEEGTRMSGDKIEVNVVTEDMKVVGNTRLDIKM